MRKSGDETQQNRAGNKSFRESSRSSGRELPLVSADSLVTAAAAANARDDGANAGDDERDEEGDDDEDYPTLQGGDWERSKIKG